VLLSEGCEPVAVRVQEKPVPFEVAHVDQSRYAVFSVPIQEGGEVVVTCRRAAAK